jgi:hypothetical protein
MSKGNIFAIMTIFVAEIIFSPLAASSYPDDDYLDVPKAI